MKSERYSKFLAGLVTSLDELEVECFPIIRRLTMSLKTVTWRILLVGLLVLLTMSQAGTVLAGNNVWTSNGPEGGMIYALAIDPATPSTLYAGTYGRGVFKSANGGASWSAANTGLTNTNVRALAINPATPSTLYAGTWDDVSVGGVFKSTDGGAAWSAVNSGLTTTDVRALVIDPATPSTLYAGTESVYKSTNGGALWTAANTGLTNPYVNALAIDPTTPSTLYAGTRGGGVFDMQQIPPSVAMSSPASDPTNASPIAVSVTFSESVTGFTSTSNSRYELECGGHIP